jgi:hypothetical protein
MISNGFLNHLCGLFRNFKHGYLLLQFDVQNFY